ncbi:MAG TPA: hypothetical protein G4O16_10145 [Dehalococcoidia bacterium]|nr:hypothetical protein [Dehalococcoidia bacterium]
MVIPVEQESIGTNDSIHVPRGETTGTYYPAYFDFPYVAEQENIWKSYYDVYLELDTPRIVKSYVGLVLNYVVREYDLAFQNQNRNLFFTWVNSYQQILDRFRSEVDSTTVIRQKPARKSSPDIKSTSFEIRPIVDVTPRIGQRYKAKLKQPQEARFEGNTTKIDY